MQPQGCHESVCLEYQVTQRKGPLDGGRGASDAATPQDSCFVKDYDAFREACVRKYGSPFRAWRLLLDPKGLGRVPFASFCSSARTMGFSDVRRLWSALDFNESGFITLDEWDHVALVNLCNFKRLCCYNYGGLDTAFKLGMDRSRSNTVTFAEFKSFCAVIEFVGDVEVLFQSFDKDQHGFFTADDLEFLQRWEGERFMQTTSSPGRIFSNASATDQKSHTNRRKRPPREMNLELRNLGKQKPLSKIVTPFRWVYPRAG